MIDFDNVSAEDLLRLHKRMQTAVEEHAEAERRAGRRRAEQERVASQRQRLQPQVEELRERVARLQPIETELVARLEKIDTNTNEADEITEALARLRSGIPSIEGAVLHERSGAVGWKRVPNPPALLVELLPDEGWESFEGLEHLRERLAGLEQKLATLVRAA
ncbi:MAG TPA: hypothetical protein VNB06_21045 [Thermoanaerobaculia bacterium]|nr:hypothetical protein [Thermoanaerobaculia bacterium]